MLADQFDPWRLSMWTVYDHPHDYPNHFVARLWEVDAKGSQPTGSIIIMQDLEALRDMLRFEMNLTVIERSKEDDPKIVEVWL